MAKIHSYYDRPICSGVTFSDPSMAMQNFRDECDVNKIIQAAVRGFDEPLYTNAQRASYFDTTSVGDFQHAMDTLNVAKADFESLPSSLRANFANDLETYVAFMSDPANAQAAIDLGLIDAPEIQANPLPVSGGALPPVGDLASQVQATE